MMSDPETIKRNIRYYERLSTGDGTTYAPADPNKLLEAAKARLANIEAEKSNGKD